MEWDLGVCAFISDVHGNRQALEAVLDDLSKEKIDRAICLGDTIGYGAKPLKCLDIVKQRAELAVLGNHDQAVLFDPEGFNGIAEASAHWTRRTIEKSSACEEYFEYLGERPRRVIRGDVLMVHGSPRKPTDEYVFPDDIFNGPKLKACFDKLGEQYISFQGHTHMPGIFPDTPDPDFIDGKELADKAYKFEAGKRYMVNVGSVGQPRDGDPRACYLVFDGETCRYRRVSYPVEDAIADIQSVRKEPEFRGIKDDEFTRFAFRLRGGR